MNDFLELLTADLAQSNSLQRSEWAQRICDEDIELIDLVPLLFVEPTLSSRCLWLLSGVANVEPDKLHSFLPYLLSIRPQIAYKKNEVTFANYFKIVGIPVEIESTVLDLLYQWIRSFHTDVTTKSRSIDALKPLIEKYPELKDEFALCLEIQSELYTPTYQRKVKKVLISMENK